MWKAPRSLITLNNLLPATFVLFVMEEKKPFIAQVIYFQTSVCIRIMQGTWLNTEI